jgi:rSAM/selenodomain-associated transferase 2
MAAPPARAAVVAEPLPDQPLVSIIIPVLNEADCLEQTLTNLLNRQWVSKHCEVIVSDGGSHDGSLEIIKRHRCKLVHSESGRARQMNTASLEARGKILLFLHADSVLGENFGAEIADTDCWGFFRLRLSGDGIAYRVIETAVNLRSRISKVAGGDQALFFNRRFFESLGRFPEIPLMEDIAISKKARNQAAPRVIQNATTSSSRRWQQGGIVKTVLLMWSLRLAFWLGVDPVRLHRIYYPQRG